MPFKKKPRPHLEIQTSGNKHYGVIRTTFREKGEIRHTTHGTIKDMRLEQLKLIQAAFRGDVLVKGSADAHQVTESKEYGASYAVLQLAKALELDKMIYSRYSEQWVKDCLAMIIGRLVYSGSKLALSHRWEDTSLWELCGIEGPVDVDKHCYKSMDRLLQRQEAIQKTLAKKHLRNGALVLYDITSSYFEGEYEDSEIVRFGYNRDGKRGHEQMVIGLLCSPEGCPVGVEVFPGNTQDAQTVLNKIAEVQKKYGIREIIFVGDRGMITHANYEKVKDVKGLNTISALTHRQIKELLERKVIQIDMFDEKEIMEVVDPEEPGRRYCLCRNPKTATREAVTRKGLLEVTKKALDRIAQSKRKSSTEKIAARVGKVLGKWKTGKFVEWSVQDGHLTWELKTEKLETEELIDGCYIIASDVPAGLMAKQEIVASYKKLALVEQAFRNLKSVQLEVRPVYHKTDDRIRCHVFLCMLAYYLQWHMNQRLKPLFQSDGKNKHRRWTFEYVLERLKSLRRQRLQVQGASCRIVGTPDNSQQKILDLLKVKL
jgi:transposase